MDPGLSAAEAARASVGERLGALVEQLNTVAEAGNSPSDHEVHQVRVATRRVGAAVAAFEGCFRPRRVKKLKRRLRAARNAAGEVRRCDVLGKLFGERLESSRDEERAAIEHVLADLNARREEALLGIADACRKKARAKLERAGERLFKRVRERGPDDDSSLPNTAGVLARIVVPQLAGALRDDADRDLAVFEHLHELRLDAKRLRYALEVFEPCFDGAAHRALYRKVVGVQDELGEINDLHDAMAWLERAWESAGGLALPAAGENGESLCAADLQRGLASLAASYRADRDSRREAFVSDWRRARAGELFAALGAMLDAPEPAEAPPIPASEPVILTRPLIPSAGEPARADRGFIAQGA